MTLTNLAAVTVLTLAQVAAICRTLGAAAAILLTSSTMPYAAKLSASALKPKIIPCAKLQKSSVGHFGLRSDIRSERSRQSRLSGIVREAEGTDADIRSRSTHDFCGPDRRGASRLYSNCALENCTRRIELRRLISSIRRIGIPYGCHRRFNRNRRGPPTG